MSYLKAYIGALIVFGAIDATWLSTMGPIVYRPALAEILAPNLRVAPAIAFYLMYPVGIVVFAITPALRSESTASAFMLALLFGAIAYATYDLTNYAILRAWTLQITILDIGYGALTSGVAAIAGLLLVRFTTR
ncbi:MAG: DUF2177 family protein [Xanthobacteraceae bacterium]